MTTTNIWTILDCAHDLATGGITVAHWYCEAMGGGFNASTHGSCSFTPDATAEGFKPYADVTESEVLAWVHASVGKDATEAALADKIAANQNPTSADGTPWAALEATP
tara:strand:- start:22 stop:345 length:324 start_codon:yes stop_codon:yes gene_type:complete